jgi:hypothetical protein
MSYLVGKSNEVEIHSSKKVVLSGLLGKTCPVGDDAMQQRDYLVRHCRKTNKRRNTEGEKSQPDWFEIDANSLLTVKVYNAM